MKNNFEVIMINDNSSDNSWDVLKKLSKNYNFLTCINLTKILDNITQLWQD